MNELLSICIPTRNRDKYLSDLLSCIENEITNYHLNESDIKIYISDNASTDKTETIVKSYQNKIPFLFYYCNSQNIGGDRNFLRCINLAKGEYIWLVGDDELITDGALVYILSVLKKERPALFINNDGHLGNKVSLPIIFNDYYSFAKYFVNKDPFILIGHSLITCNIFKRSVFDYTFAEQMLHTRYGHMYGLVSGISKNPGKVYLPEIQTIIIRKERAAMENLNREVLKNEWFCYLKWIKSYLKLEELEPISLIHKLVPRTTFLDYIYQKLKVFFVHHPFWPFLRPIKKRCEQIFFKDNK